MSRGACSARVRPPRARTRRTRRCGAGSHKTQLKSTWVGLPACVRRPRLLCVVMKVCACAARLPVGAAAPTVDRGHTRRPHAREAHFPRGPTRTRPRAVRQARGYTSAARRQSTDAFGHIMHRYSASIQCIDALHRCTLPMRFTGGAAGLRIHLCGRTWDAALVQCIDALHRCI